MSSAIGRVVGVVLVGALLFFSAKGCIVTTGSSPKSSETYQAQGSDGRSMTMVLLPGHHTMIWYSDPSSPRLEGVLSRMRGSYGTHYFGQLWHVEGPGVWFGYRIYPSGAEPVNMEIQILEKFSSGSGDSSFANKGDTVHEVMWFGNDSVEFGGSVLHRAMTDESAVSALLAKLGGPKPLR